MKVLTALILLFYIRLLHGGPFDPTQEEINRRLVVPAPREWGDLARIQKSLRILCIGGSNTAAFNDSYSHDVHYSYYMDQYIRHNMSKYLVPEHSFALGRGVSGQGPEHFIGKKFDFEFHDREVWPNVVILEFAVNMPSPRMYSANDSMLAMEKLVRSIMFKYKQVNLPRPDFMFYNVDHSLFLVLASLKYANTSDRIEFAKHYYDMPDVFMSDHLIKQFAEFYHFPIISWGEVGLPAAIRHFVNHTSIYYDEPWAYSRDGIHVSGPFGSLFVVNTLLGPFLDDVMSMPPSSATVSSLPRPDPPRMFPPSPVLMEIAPYSSFGRPITLFELRDIVHDMNHSDWQLRDFPHVQYCFGSDHRGGVGELRFHVPPSCNHQFACQVQIGMMRSGNESRIGNASCTMHRHIPSPEQVGSVLIIDGQAVVREWQTFAVSSTFDANVTEGKYSVRCVNLFAERLSCMTALSVNSVVVV